MPVSAARAAAFDILLRVEREDSFATELLHSDRLSAHSPADRALCTELVMGTLRWQAVLDRAITQFAGRTIQKLDLEIVIALRLGAYQLLYLERVPARAAVNESVELAKRARKRSAVGFVNAVLRKLAQQPRSDLSGSQPQTASQVADGFSHPEWLVQRWVENYGLVQTDAICRYDQQAPPAVLHLPLDTDARAAVETELMTHGVRLKPGMLVSCSRIVVSGTVQASSTFAAGRVWFQDEASQLVALLVGHGKRVLDCCAAPGGKTAVLAERNPRSTIVAAELHPHRARLLRERVPASNVEVVTADVTTLPGESRYDRVLADVPCSGTGTLARNPEIRWRLRLEDLEELHRRQAAILQAGISRLETGGRLVYSTCSLEPEEGEDVVRELLENMPGLRLVECGSELRQLQQAGELRNVDIESLCRGPFLRTIPGIHPCDGFFAALIERP